MADEIKDNPISQASLAVRVIRQFLVAGLLINLVSLAFGLRHAYGVGSVFGFSGSRLLALFPLIFFSLVLFTLLLLLKSDKFQIVYKVSDSIKTRLDSVGNWFFLLSLLPVIFVFFYFLMGDGLPILSNPLGYWLLGYLGLLSAACLVLSQKVPPSLALIVSFSFYSVVLGLIYFTPELTSFPLSVDWSESSRFYDASLFLSRWVYGRRLPLPALDPTRAFLQSIPFIIPSLPIWLHRLWKVALWLGISLSVGFALALHLKIKNRWMVLSMGAWFLIFILQGPFYFHLMIIVITVLVGFDKHRLTRSLVILVLASFWAGVSRVNWFPMAGILAVTLYVLETPKAEKDFWQYWGWPVLAVLVSLVTAFGSQALYALISGNPATSFTTSFNSPLLWYRLLPSDAYGWGVLPLTLIAGLPLWLIIFWRLLQFEKRWWFLRIMALFAILGTLFAAGLLVSTKIGGGNNIHNLDTYLVTLAIVAVYLGLDRFVPDQTSTVRSSPVPIFLVGLAALVPFMTLLNNVRPYVKFDNEKVMQDIQQIRAVIDQEVRGDEQVLFIHQRHLSLFGYIQNIDIVPEYEKVFLMEAAMSGNQVYLQNFRKDLKEHRFALIITESIAMVNRSAADTFGEENNAWVERVAKPITEHYRVLLNLKESGIAILVPKD